MNWNPRILHLILELGQAATLVTTLASFAGPLTPLLGPYAPIVGAASGVASGYLTWLKAQNVGNIPPASNSTPAAPSK